MTANIYSYTQDDLAERLEEAERIIFLLTADHNSGTTYVKGFDMAQEYFAKYPQSATGVRD